GSAMKPRPLPLLAATLAVLLAGTASANDPAQQATHDAAAAKELKQAHDALRRAAQRVAELSGRQGAIAEAARERIAQARSRPMVGVLLSGDDQAGVRITGVTPDGAAAKAGLRSGDRLVSVDGTPILGSSGELRMQNARTLLGKLQSGKPARLGYLRDGRSEWVEGGHVEHARAVARKELDAGLLALRSAPGIPPEVRREVIRLSREGADCSGEDCRTPRLLSAFRWNGLNLAAVDSQLG